MHPESQPYLPRRLPGQWERATLLVPHSPQRRFLLALLSRMGQKRINEIHRLRQRVLAKLKHIRPSIYEEIQVRPQYNHPRLAIHHHARRTPGAGRHSDSGRRRFHSPMRPPAHGRATGTDLAFWACDRGHVLSHAQRLLAHGGRLCRGRHDAHAAQQAPSGYRGCKGLAQPTLIFPYSTSHGSLLPVVGSSLCS